MSGCSWEAIRTISEGLADSPITVKSKQKIDPGGLIVEIYRRVIVYCRHITHRGRSSDSVYEHSALVTGGLQVQQKADPTADLDAFTAIKRIDEMEIELLDRWLRQIDESPERTCDRKNLLELRTLCQLRRRILNNMELKSPLRTGAA